MIKNIKGIIILIILKTVYCFLDTNRVVLAINCGF